MDKQKLFLEHSTKEKQVIEFFNQAVEEIKSVFFSPDAPKIVGIRLQMISAFTLAEVFSNFWDCYIDQHRGPKQRLTDWIDNFCLKDQNETFKSNSYFGRLGAKSLVDLRHSLIHFFGLSPQKMGEQIGLGSSHMDDKTFQNVSKGLGTNVTVFKPIDFYSLFKDGGLLMLNEMVDNIHQSQLEEAKKWRHVEGIDRIFRKFQTEGAMKVLIPKTNSIMHN